MRTRLAVALTAALLATPFVSAAAVASPWDHKCDEDSVTVEHKCETSFSEDHCDEAASLEEKCDDPKG